MMDEVIAKAKGLLLNKKHNKMGDDLKEPVYNVPESVFMSLLYKKESDLKYRVEVKLFPDEKVVLQFSADCGKFGTDETLDEYEFTIKELLSILQKHDAGG